MNALGRHILAEIYECTQDILSDREFIENIMVEAALEAGAEIREVAFHKFTPNGVSGVVIISESHLAIHTWPEEEYLRYAAIDVFTCGDKIDPMDAVNFLIEKLNPKKIYIKQFIRGIGEIIEIKRSN